MLSVNIGDFTVCWESIFFFFPGRGMFFQPACVEVGMSVRFIIIQSNHGAPLPSFSCLMRAPHQKHGIVFSGTSVSSCPSREAVMSSGPLHGSRCQYIYVYRYTNAAPTGTVHDPVW